LIAVAPEAYTRHLPAFPTRRPSDLIGEPAEQVQLESCDAAAQAKALAVRAAAASAVVGRAAHADERELLGTDRPRAGASRFEVGGCNAQVAVVRQRLLGQPEKARIAEDIGVVDRSQRRFALH